MCFIQVIAPIAMMNALAEPNERPRTGRNEVVVVISLGMDVSHVLSSFPQMQKGVCSGLPPTASRRSAHGRVGFARSRDVGQGRRQAASAPW